MKEEGRQIDSNRKTYGKILWLLNISNLTKCMNKRELED
jgi:hypothetical protein